MDKIAALQHTDLFYNLSAEQLTLVAGIAQERRAGRNEVIFEEGSDSRDIFVLIQGHVEVSHRYPAQDGEPQAPEPVILATLSAGQSFGEISFIDRAAREATVRSLDDDTVLLAIHPDALMQACEANPALGFFIIRNIARELAFIIRELDMHIVGRIYWNFPNQA